MSLSLILESKTMLADTLTPVNIYLKLRDAYAYGVLLESTDYHGRENSRSYICCDPLAEFKVQDERISVRYLGSQARITMIVTGGQVVRALDEFRKSFVLEGESLDAEGSGLFGYVAYDAARYFDEVEMDASNREGPDILYRVYRFVIVIDHFSNELTIHEYRPNTDVKSGMEHMEKTIFTNRFSTFSFLAEPDEEESLTELEFMEMVEQGKKHCFRGDVFQLVLSRGFTRRFRGDEFNVYRALRSINPSPYLFYFDFGDFRIFGSSPEAQLKIRGKYATINPIAGTFKRTGNESGDTLQASKLAADEKENAEHLMLVDLARNDLNRNTDEVSVIAFKQIQYYSHVIHLVSQVSGKLREGVSPVQLACDTFPAGTLSGAPKFRAMQLINSYEKTSRGFYGGAIGFMGFNGDYNHAIMIRTFLSRRNTLTFRAGAGVVAKSDAIKELEEVNNKLEALRRAIVLAEKI